MDGDVENIRAHKHTLMRIKTLRSGSHNMKELYFRYLQIIISMKWHLLLFNSADSLLSK